MIELELAQKLEAYRRTPPPTLETLFDPARQAAERSLCETLEILVQPHVGVSCDGLEIRSFTEPTAGSIEIRGHMWCLGNSGESWKEPFFARIEVSASREISSYSFGIGSSADGLGRFRFKTPEPSTAEDCLFYFEK